jgi:hypothetical protein
LDPVPLIEIAAQYRDTLSKTGTAAAKYQVSERSITTLSCLTLLSSKTYPERVASKDERSGSPKSNCIQKLCHSSQLRQFDDPVHKNKYVPSRIQSTDAI